jgi:hypothetical protein
MRASGARQCWLQPTALEDQVARSGRVFVRTLEGHERDDVLNALGYPELIPKEGK